MRSSSAFGNREPLFDPPRFHGDVPTVYAEAMPSPYVRHTAKIEGDFVVFLIGAQIRKPWMLPTVIKVGRAMSAMMKELEANPQLGYLGQEQFGGVRGVQIQYWRSRQHLMDYARSKDSVHLPAWKHFNQVVAKTTAVGIWHETYLVRAGEYECIYGNMPVMGLAKAAARVEVGGTQHTAAGRLGLTDGGDTPEGTAI